MLGQQAPMRRSRDLPRLGGRQEALSDAISRIFSERASFELREDDVEALRKQLQNGSITHSVGSPAALQAQREAEELATWKESHPCLLSNLRQFFDLSKGKRVTVFMDYDGTLTPIVKDPDRAFMSDQMRDAVRAVARLFPTAIISGRGREKVEGFVKLKELYYAGSHGMDIVGPTLANSDTKALSFQAAAKFEPVMDAVYANLVERTKAIPGASVEHNKFCVSVHFRNCEPERLEEVIGAVEAVLSSDKELKATRGRKVLEIRPEVEWNKGHALAHLLESLELGDMNDVVPIYIGDDRTDEDAFAVLNHRQNGIGILVSSKVKPTQAVYTLQDPVEVMTFLANLVNWGRTADNGWQEAKTCTGWRLNNDVAVVEPSTPTRVLSGDSSEPSGTGDEEPSNYARRPSGRPPLCPPGTRLSYSVNDVVGLMSSKSSSRTTSPLLKPPAHHRNGDVQSSLLPSGSADDERTPPSPFGSTPIWADTLNPRQESPATPWQSAANSAPTTPDQPSSNGADGPPKPETSLENIIMAVADSIRGATQGGDVQKESD